MSTSYLQLLNTTGQSDWYQLYPVASSIIDEYVRANSTNYNIIAFLRELLTSEFNWRETNTGIVKITFRLFQEKYALNQIQDVENVYGLFYINSRLELTTEQAAYTIKKAGQFARLMVDSSSSSCSGCNDEWNSSPNENRELNVSVRKLFWIINVTYDAFLVNNSNIFHIQYRELMVQLFDLKEMNSRFYQWDNEKLYLFKSVLITNARLRKKFETTNPEITSMLDSYCADLVLHALNFKGSKCLFPIDSLNVKELFYITYVRKIRPSSLFQQHKSPPSSVLENLYIPVNLEDVMPHSINYTVSNFEIEIKYNYIPNMEEMKQIINQTYDGFQDMKSQIDDAIIKIPITKPAEGSTIETSEAEPKSSFHLYVFDNKGEYIKYGGLFDIDTNSGGQMRVNGNRYEAFVYRQNATIRNLAHEITHCLFFEYVGSPFANNLPAWIIEGTATYIGNAHEQPCVANQIDYIAKRLSEPSLSRNNIVRSLIYKNSRSDTDVYFLGGALCQYLLETNSTLLSECIENVRSGATLNGINDAIISLWANDVDTELNFQRWLNQKLMAHEVCLGPTLRQLRVLLEHEKERVEEEEEEKDQEIEQLLSRIDFSRYYNDIDQCINSNKDTILHVAVREKHLRVIWNIMNIGARVDLKNDDGDTPLNIANRFDTITKETIIRYIDDAIIQRSSAISSRRSPPSWPFPQVAHIRQGTGDQCLVLKLGMPFVPLGAKPTERAATTLSSNTTTTALPVITAVLTTTIMTASQPPLLARTTTTTTGWLSSIMETGGNATFSPTNTTIVDNNTYLPTFTDDSTTLSAPTSATSIDVFLIGFASIACILVLLEIFIMVLKERNMKRHQRRSYIAVKQSSAAHTPNKTSQQQPAGEDETLV